VSGLIGATPTADAAPTARSDNEPLRDGQPRDAHGPAARAAASAALQPQPRRRGAEKTPLLIDQLATIAAGDGERSTGSAQTGAIRFGFVIMMSAPTPPIELVIAQWKADAEAIGVDLNTEWTTWVHTRAMMRAVGDSERARTHPEAIYLQAFILRAAMSQVILGIRRQVDGDRRAHSLRNFLQHIIAHPTYYSIEDCINTFLDRADRWQATGQQRERYEQEARMLYAQLADASGRALDPVKVQTDLANLIATCDSLKTAADHHIAHRDRNAPDFNATFQDIEDIIEKVRTLQRKYTRLFDGGGAGLGQPKEEEMRSFYRFPWLADVDEIS